MENIESYLTIAAAFFIVTVSPGPANLALATVAMMNSFHQGQSIEVAVQHVLRAGAFVAGAQVLHQLIGLQNVRADLVTPADVGLRRASALAFSSRFCSSSS
jgi:hypothetical protein